MYRLICLLPKNLISRLAGFLAGFKFPKPILVWFLKIYCKHYNINLAEAQRPIEEYSTFNDFFTRRLKPGTREADKSPASFVSPVDGTVSSVAKIENGLMLQAKGSYYTLADLVGDNQAKEYEGGWQVTLYLSPADYHRIHSPCDAKAELVSYFSGNLWPVNPLFVGRLGGLFSLNERLYTKFTTNWGIFGMVKVGALIVGSIQTTYAPFTSNSGMMSFEEMLLKPPPSFNKSDELGLFCLGSTVILLLPPEFAVPLPSIAEGFKITLGQTIANIKNI